MIENYFGVMLDMSRDGVMKVEQVKEYVSIIKKMGYNSIMLYTEDTYEVDNEPWFGYLRGRYTKSELKEIDSFCCSIGVELIPCIQTLAHLNAIFKWTDYGPINDVNDILLVDEERTYILIRNMFSTLKECFSSKQVNIGMDEAHMLGLGKYLDKHGYSNRFEILSHHLRKVIKIAKEFGFRPMMWSDMFFRLINNGEYWGKDLKITDEIKKVVPKEVNLIYWDYYHEAKDDYSNMIDYHNQLTENDIWFAGGAWTWAGFAPMNHYSFKTMKPAMEVCREKGVKNIFLTVWGNYGRDCSCFSILPTLFYSKCIFDGITDINEIKSKFKEITNENFDDILDFDLPNMVCGNVDTTKNPSKYCFYSDLFTGFTDSSLPKGCENDFKKYAKLLKEKGKESKYKYLFDFYSNLCNVLKDKYYLGVELRTAYKNKDKEKLVLLSRRILKVENSVKKFIKSFKVLWFKENKPHGFDIQEIRIGGLLQRLKSCRERVCDYLDGKIDEIPELNETLLPAFIDNENDQKLIELDSWIYGSTVNIY